MRHVPGRDIGQLEFQAPQRVDVPDAIGRAQIDAWRRRHDAMLDEGFARRRQLMAQAMEAEYLAATTRERNPTGSASSSSQNQNIAIILSLRSTLKEKSSQYR